MGNRFFAALLSIFLAAPVSGWAQRAVGIDWHIPAKQSEAVADLQDFSELGITHLQIEQELDQQTWQLIDSLQFTVFGKLPVDFAVTQSFSEMDSAFTGRLQKLADHYNAQNIVQGIGIFFVGATYDEEFQQAVSSFTQRLGKDVQKPFYYTTTESESTKTSSDFSFQIILSGNADETISDQAGGFLYKPEPGMQWRLASVKSFIESTSNRLQTPIFFESSWLEEMVNRHPDFAQTLRLYATSVDPVFPLPQKSDHKIDSNTIIVVMLLLAWLIFGATYNYNPVFRKSFMRYFTGHTFFVDDVIQRHIRSLFTGFSILIQHAICGGIVLYCLFHSVFSPLGYEALYSHYDILAIFGTGALGLFIWGCLFTLVIEIVSILWLWIVNPATEYLSQIVNLYPWLLQLNLIITTFIAAVYLPGGNSVLIYLLTGLFIILFIGSFILTAFDTVRHVTSRRLWVYAGTLGGYSIVLAGLIIWIGLSPKLLNVVELAGLLP